VHVLEVRAVIKIRYTDLPAGVHVRTTTRGRHTVVLLLPGLTPAQRKAAIRRAQGASRVGQGPPLPRAALARALAADRLRTTIRNGFGAMRMHPAIFFPPLVIVLSAAAAYLLLVSVTIHIMPGPQPRGPGAVAAAVPGGAALLSPSPGHDLSPPPPDGSSPAPSIPGPLPSTVRPTTKGPVPPVKSPDPPRSSPGSPPAPTPTPSSSSPSGPSPRPLPSDNPSPSPAPTAFPVPLPTSSGGGTVCVKVGPLGVCLGGL
jgi:hypothetical protein